MILNKLSALLDRVPDLPPNRHLTTQDVPRQWISTARALISQYDPLRIGITLTTKIELLSQYPYHSVNAIIGYVIDTFEKIKLELELDGRSEIGTAYAPGDVYRYFTDLKHIIEGADREILLIDPYLDGRTFDACFSNCPPELSIKILTERYAEDVTTYAAKHRIQFATTIEIRKSIELHDRLIMIDRDECWISGGSIKDGGNKATYLVPLSPPIPEAKQRIYDVIWSRADTVWPD